MPANYVAYREIEYMVRRGELERVCRIRKPGLRPYKPDWAFAYRGKFGRGWTVERDAGHGEYFKEFYIYVK